ncbi:uncharacterized protein [Panulirus ornatus]|uniref:uncharacterized protein n=1 Tax=Panulirus ornatus TaxID=150431 RepID=UPI003A85B5EC
MLHTMVQNCCTRVGEGGQLCLHSTSSVFSVRTSLKPAPLQAKWAVLALVVGLGSQVGTWAAHQDDHSGRCTPCNSTVEVPNSELPAVGFICPNAPLHHPYTCLVFFRNPHNLTIHLHHFYPDHMSVVLCSTMYYDSWPALAGEEDRLCVSLQQLARFRDVDHPVYLNISTLPMEPYSQAFLTHHPNTGRRGFNFTYEMRSWGDSEPAVGGLDHAHLGDCSYNGVPVLHQLSNRKFRYSCQCSAGARGDHCHLGGLCTSSRDPRSWCSYHGQCRFIAGESICACAEGYYGAICQYHFTTIPSYDKTCGGLRHCHHNCHLRVEAQARHAYCSCTAGYLPSNTTHCLAQEDWDVSVSLRLWGGPPYTQEHLLNKTLRVVAASGGSSEVVRNLTVTSHKVPITSRSGGGEGGGGGGGEEVAMMVVVEVSVEGTALARRLTQKTPWRQEFGGGAAEIVATRLPQLSVGPVWAESGSEAALVLSCPVYGGPHLQLTWYKDQTVIYKHNVSYCSFEGETPRLHVVAERGTSDHECTVMVWVYRPQQEDHGTYVCHVVDRGYQATQMVVAGLNQSLQLELMPRVLTINQGDDVTVTCVTKNRGWAHPDHYQAFWRLQPPPGRRAYGPVTHTHIRRRGSLIHVFNVTESLNLTCTMKEKEGVVWMPQDVDGAEAQASAVVRVLIPGAPACPDDLAYGVTWRRTPVGERDEAPCPHGYRGEAATRYCRNQQQPDPRRAAPTWDVPDFSGCIYEPLVYIRTPLYLDQRGYNSLPDDVDSLAEDLLTLLQERVQPILPGEGSSVIDIMEMLEATELRRRRRRRSIISMPVFLGILEAVVAHREALSSTDTWRMLQMTRKYLRTMLESPSSKDESVRLHKVAAEVKQLHQGQEAVLTVVSNAKTPSEDDSLWLMNVTVEAVWTDTLRTEDPPNEVIERESLHMQGLPEEEVGWQQGHHRQQQQETVVVGVVIFAHLYPHLPVSRSEDSEGLVWVGAPLVEVLAASRQHPPPTSESSAADYKTHTQGSSSTPGTDAHTTVSHLVYFDCTQRPRWLENRSEEGPWVSGCGRVAMVGGVLQWDLGPCSTVEAADGGPEGGRCECHCRGPGLYSLLLVPPSPPEVRQEKLWWTGDQAVMGSCVASLVVVVACVLLQLPRASHTTVQLRILKCLSLGGLDLTFVVFALWPTSQGVHEGVLVAGSACLMLCVGVGVSEQVAMHQQLALTPYTTPISPAHLTTVMVLVLSVMVGVMVGLVQRLHHYHLGPPWLPLGVAWGLTAAVLSSLAALSLLWAALTGHNLRRLALIKAATPSHRNLTLVEGRVRQMVVVMGGEWTLIFTSLFQHHPVGRYLFCLATVAQSVVTLVVYTCAGDDLGGSRWCRCLPSHRRRAPPDDGDELGDGGRRGQGLYGRADGL